MSAKEEFRIEFEKMVETVKADTEARHVRGEFDGNFCPELQFIRLDAMDDKDFPHGIADNSVFLEFKVDLALQKVELFRQGHLWLTDEDREANPRYKYLAMKSMTQAHVDLDGKKFRKCGYKDAKDLQRKIEGYFREVMKSVVKHSGEYPYGKDK